VDEQIREHERAVRALEGQMKEHDGTVWALEEQIREHKRATIKLRRARNSLLDVSKLPPEILGDIFHRNVSPRSDFGGLEKRSHNFLCVCHHWYEVASGTPELWSFWGNTLQDWARWCRRSGTGPLDLVLKDDEYYCGNSDAIVRNTLRDHAAADRIRRVHLTSVNSEFLSSIIASLTVKCDEVRSNSMESFVLWGHDERGVVGLSDFFARYRFPKLRRLDLTCTASAWDHINSRTGALIDLDVEFAEPEPGPTTSQLLSALTSNPLLQRLVLYSRAIPNDGGGESSFRVPLHHLKQLTLLGNSRDVIRLLHRLDHPARLDRLSLTLYHWTVVEISQVIGPCFRDYLRGRGTSQNGLGLSLSSDDMIILDTGDARGIGPPLRQVNTFMTVALGYNEALSRDVRENVILELISHAPQEEIVYFQTHGNFVAMGNVYTKFPNLTTLSLAKIPLSSAFPKPNPGEDEGILRSLRYVSLRELVVDDGDWSPLATFLARHASSRNRLDMLEISYSPHMYSEVMESISGVVRELEIEHVSGRARARRLIGFGRSRYSRV